MSRMAPLRTLRPALRARAAGLQNVPKRCATIHAQPASAIDKPLAEPLDNQERQMEEHGHHHHPQKVHEDVYDDSRDFSTWRWASLALAGALLLYYQEAGINDQRYTIAGYDVDQAKTWQQDFERSGLWRTFKGFFAAPEPTLEAKYASLGPKLKDERRHVEDYHTEHNYAKPKVRRVDANGAEMVERPFVLRLPPVQPTAPTVTIDGLRVSKEQAWPNRPPSRAQQASSEEGGEEQQSGEGEQAGEEEDS